MGPECAGPLHSLPERKLRIMAHAAGPGQRTAGSGRRADLRRSGSRRQSNLLAQAWRDHVHFLDGFKTNGVAYRAVDSGWNNGPGHGIVHGSQQPFRNRFLKPASFNGGEGGEK